MKTHYKFLGSVAILVFAFMIRTSVAEAALAICTSGMPADPAPNGNLSVLTDVKLCTKHSDNTTTCNNLPSIMTPTLETANTLASLLGASVKAINNIFGDPNTTQSAPVYELVFPNGYQVDAGYVAYLYNNNFDPKQDIGFQQIIQGACGTGIGGGGGNTGGSGTGGTGGTGGGTTGGTAGTGAITSIINNAIKNLQDILNKIGGGSNNSNSATKTVTVDLLNVRTSPTTSASIVKQFRRGDTFVAADSTQGESVEGVSKWWLINNSGTSWYAWSGGTSQ